MQKIQHSGYLLMKLIVQVIFTIFLALTSNNNIYAQFVQQGTKLLGSGAVGGSFQGQSVAVSADGNTVIIGGPSYNGGMPGAAWVYTRTAGGNIQGDILIGTGAVGGSGQGSSVAISADGNTAIFGGPGDDNRNGAVWIFTRSGGTWTQQGNKLVVIGWGEAISLGTSVSLSADGNTALAGAPGIHGNDGTAFVFIRSGGTWTQQGGALGGVSGGSRRGHSVSLSSDGNTAIIGGPLFNSSPSGYDGAVWIYARSVGVWTEQAYIESPDPLELVLAFQYLFLQTVKQQSLVKVLIIAV